MAVETHYLKVRIKQFEQVRSKNTMLKVINDRDFKVGERIVLEEFSHKKQEATGNAFVRKIEKIFKATDKHHVELQLKNPFTNE